MTVPQRCFDWMDSIDSIAVIGSIIRSLTCRGKQTSTIDETLQFGDEVFSINTTVRTDFDLLIAKMAYTWSFIERPKGYLGATLGVYVADGTIGISEPNLGSAETGDITAPLPVVGLRGEYLLSDRWSLRAQLGAFFPGN